MVKKVFQPARIALVGEQTAACGQLSGQYET
jgi:hypothetical protein